MNLSKEWVMSNSIQITSALCLPAPDIEALSQGRILACLSRGYIHIGRAFALYPSDVLPSFLIVEKHYRPNFLSVAEEVLKNLNYQRTSVGTWARCEQCKALANFKSLEILSNSTIWKLEALQKVLAEHPNTFLIYLRVYPLHPFEMESRSVTVGDFISLPKPLLVSDASPILSDRIFTKRNQQLEEFKPTLHPELEDLLSAVALVANNDLAAKKLEQDIRIFLGWTETSIVSRLDPKLDWIGRIAAVGNSSDGDGFEKLVRRALIKLGFSNSNLNQRASLDPEKTGGRGGLDFYCEKPYQIVGECKATKNEVMHDKGDGAPAQLIKLGNKILLEQYENCIKIIVAVGELTADAKETTIGNKMNIIRPETLQKLVELKVKYVGSIDLLELKPYLKEAPFGEDADLKVNEYINKVIQKIELRSHIVKVVRTHLETVKREDAKVNELHTAYIYSNPPQEIKSEERLRDMLIELSSPMTGYLGRIEGEDWQSDRFYFLRDLLVD
jgi:Domain of unknown function (DUF1802)